MDHHNLLSQRHKIFICMGNFPTLRNSLRCRQWIEKNYKTRQTNANIAQVMVHHRENDVDEEKCNLLYQKDETASNSLSEDSLKEATKANTKTLLIRAKHSSPTLDSILDRQCRLMVSYNIISDIALFYFDIINIVNY